MQSFDKWLDINYDELMIQFAKSGADREIDFDFEEESYDVYVQCCGNNLHHMGNYGLYFKRCKYIRR